MNRPLKQILLATLTLSALAILAVQIFAYFFYYEDEFTKESIHYNFLTKNMQTVFVINPKNKPIYSCQEHGNGGRICFVRYRSLLSKEELEERFVDMGYGYKNNYLSDKNDKIRIEVVQSNVMINEVDNN